MCERVFGISADNPISMETALTNGTAPGLYVREGDDTSDWETYRQVLARRVEEAVATIDTARQNLPVGIQLRAAGGVVGRRDSGGTTAARGVQSETPAAASPPPTPSRFSLLEVDLPPEPTSSNSGSLDADLAALQEELRVEREINRAQAAAQMQKSRFDLLECDLPAVPVTAAPVAAVAVKASPRPVVSSPPKSRNPVETITDLTTARSPL
jgi:hypothetical protein